MTDLTLYKSILEIRYPPTASLFDVRGQIASRWQWTDDFSEWQITRNQVTVHNKPSSKFLSVGLGTTTVIFEHPESYASFASKAEVFVTWVLGALRPRQIDRIGLRLIQISEQEDFDLLVERIRKRLYKFSEDEWKIFGGVPADVGFPLVLDLGKDRANFNFGPMKREQLSGYFTSSDAKESLPDVAMFFDFDLYTTGSEIKPKEYKKFFRGYLASGRDTILTMTSQFLEKIEE